MLLCVLSYVTLRFSKPEETNKLIKILEMLSVKCVLLIVYFFASCKFVTYSVQSNNICNRLECVTVFFAYSVLLQ